MIRLSRVFLLVDKRDDTWANCNYQMIVVLVWVFLLGFIDGRTCGANPSACIGTQKCLYQQGVDTCMRQLLSENTTYTLDSATMNYFYWVIDKSHTEITIQIHNQNNAPRILKMGIRTQTSYSLEESPKRSNKIILEGVGDSEEINLSSEKFCQTQQGQNCLIIIGYSLISSIPINITMNIKSRGKQVDVKGIIYLCLVILYLVGLLVYHLVRVIKKYRRNYSKNKLSYFEAYIPKQGMSEIEPNYYKEMKNKSCNICIHDIKGYSMVRKLFCGHIFHSRCVDNWCFRNLSCPTCGYPLDEESLKTKSRQRNGGEIGLQQYQKQDNQLIQVP